MPVGGGWLVFPTATGLPTHKAKATLAPIE